MNLKSNPAITWVGQNKETLWFNGDYQRTTLCDNDLEGYQHAVEYARTHASAVLQQDRARVLVGDWSATHLSCLCCPLVFKTMNPKIKLLAVLRDPVSRVLSRFMEQKALKFGACHAEVVNETFQSYVAKELDKLECCRKLAARYTGGNGGTQRGQPAVAYGAATTREQQQQQRPAAGWGGGMDLGNWMAAQCAAKSNILGWSVYDVFLENYLAHFPQEQLLVLYTDELAADPLAVLRKVEGFLGAEPGNYSAEGLALVYNSRGCYSWQCARKKGEVRWLTPSGAMSRSTSSSARGGASSNDGTVGGARGGGAAALRGGAGASGGSYDGDIDPQGQQQHEQQPAFLPDGDSPFGHAVARLVDFYRPHMQRLFAWADQGLIAPPPAAWRSRYDVLATGRWR
ncbi:hypothetical protein VOLCADRAFT_95855 [Volvox carteri f. nagariensis]|uniref:Sulfotransferase n=1 Tax=Volvox carteri f. nagariensis TaxID=3068 RepID=D8U8J9_VOLCA|nr:uncharacterized protein VOLCADRAFT_95855 [Volvox carteri f. nagariensis]EFJ43994.1 hypothetical protein VOLCADRAFT_95855 [Volvox carteri f. nagariensis]|eukprot:XP_002955006.1 hypothetical protein VOLCADRAFT_95855 [Volvox carteri f. nagariensis]